MKRPHTIRAPRASVTRVVTVKGPGRGFAAMVALAVIVGATGELSDVSVSVKNAMLGGNIKGNITASNKVTLESTSRLEGDLTAKLLVIEEGALFSGNCKSGDNSAQQRPAQDESRKYLDKL